MFKLKNTHGGKRTGSGRKKKQEVDVVRPELSVVDVLIEAEAKLLAAQQQVVAEVIHKTGMSQKDLAYVMDNAPYLLPPSFHAVRAQYEKTLMTVRQAQSLLPDAPQALLLEVDQAVANL